MDKKELENLILERIEDICNEITYRRVDEAVKYSKAIKDLSKTLLNLRKETSSTQSKE
jgi:hypothetical protein